MISCHFSWIYELSIGQIRGELQILHGVDDHDLVHLVHDVPLVENLMRGLLPAHLMLEMPHVDCFQKILDLKKSLYVAFVKVYHRPILTLLITATSFSGISD